MGSRSLVGPDLSPVLREGREVGEGSGEPETVGWKPRVFPGGDSLDVRIARGTGGPGGGRDKQHWFRGSRGDLVLSHLRRVLKHGARLSEVAVVDHARGSRAAHVPCRGAMGVSAGVAGVEPGCERLWRRGILGSGCGMSVRVQWEFRRVWRGRLRVGGGHGAGGICGGLEARPMRWGGARPRASDLGRVGASRDRCRSRPLRRPWGGEAPGGARGRGRRSRTEHRWDPHPAWLAEGGRP